MKRVLVFCTLLVFLRAGNLTASPHKVRVSGSDKESGAVIDALNARLRGTERYQVTDDSRGADLEIVVICSSMETYKLNGAICSYLFFYIPPSAPLLRLPIGSAFGQAEDKNRATLGEMIFQAFLTNTTQQKIQEVDNDVRASVAIFCAEPKNAEAFCGKK